MIEAVPSLIPGQGSRTGNAGSINDQTYPILYSPLLSLFGFHKHKPNNGEGQPGSKTNI